MLGLGLRLGLVSGWMSSLEKQRSLRIEPGSARFVSIRVDVSTRIRVGVSVAGRGFVINRKSKLVRFRVR